MATRRARPTPGLVVVAAHHHPPLDDHRSEESTPRSLLTTAPLPVAEGDLWVFFASRSPHQTEPLECDAPRIVFGFGWSVPPAHVLEPPPEGWEEG